MVSSSVLAQQSSDTDASTGADATAGGLHGGIISNQGASIDGAGDVAIDAATNQATPVQSDADGVNETDEALDIANNEDDATSQRAVGAAAAKSSRTIPLPSGDQLLRGDDSPTPWYRSGIMSLVIVLVIIGGAAMLLRRLVPQVAGGAGGAIDMLARTHISPRQSMALVRVGRRVLLIGITPERMTVLCETNDPEEVALLLGKSRRPVSADDGFESMMARSSASFDDDDDDDDASAEFVRGPSDGLMAAQGRLKGLLAKLHTVRS